MTNYEKIKQMDKDELSNFLCNLMCGDCCENRCPATDLCSTRQSGMKVWLERDNADDGNE